MAFKSVYFDWRCHIVGADIRRGPHRFGVHDEEPFTTGDKHLYVLYTAATHGMKHIGNYTFENIHTGEKRIFKNLMDSAINIPRRKEPRVENYEVLAVAYNTAFAPDSKAVKNTLEILLPQPIYEAIWDALAPRRLRDILLDEPYLCKTRFSGVAIRIKEILDD